MTIDFELIRHDIPFERELVYRDLLIEEKYLESFFAICKVRRYTIYGSDIYLVRNRRSYYFNTVALRDHDLSEDKISQQLWLYDKIRQEIESLKEYSVIGTIPEIIHLSSTENHFYHRQKLTIDFKTEDSFEDSILFSPTGSWNSLSVDHLKKHRIWS